MDAVTYFLDVKKKIRKIIDKSTTNVRAFVLPDEKFYSDVVSTRGRQVSNADTLRTSLLLIKNSHEEKRRASNQRPGIILALILFPKNINCDKLYYFHTAFI